eukprot:CAMPEP_0180634636 /NCGR_PEP_ID=MMETSP1037_2-20121125/42234_1 /TAXON_ID=632150 /ORGANISM="Azadinium spinosum, Strain 3D9" /LENGTH=281 /DNA_ID=CAMNT_0022655785 /DNA_START=69 /DNA_END=915 /DNA_ORIENTATION=-
MSSSSPWRSGALWFLLSTVRVGAVGAGTCKENEVSQAVATGTAQMQVKSSHNNSRRMDLAQNPDDSQLHLLQEQCPCAVAFLGGLRAHHTISSDQSCEPFCADNGCPCLLPWAKRCELNSCSTCNECGAVRCSCTGLGNEYSCDDNTRGYCSSSGACLNTGTFMKGDWSAGCGSPTTTTPPTTTTTTTPPTTTTTTTPPTTTTTTTPPPPPECQCSLPGKAADYNCNDQTSAIVHTVLGTAMALENSSKGMRPQLANLPVLAPHPQVTAALMAQQDGAHPV